MYRPPGITWRASRVSESITGSWKSGILPDTLDIVFVTADLESMTTRQRRDENFRTGRLVRRNDETSLNRPNAQKLGFESEF